MGNAYNLLCIDCITYLSVGKLYCEEEADQKISWKMGGWRDFETDGWISREEILKLLEKFLILHRGHQLIMVPDSFFETIENADTINDIERISELMNQEIDPEPNPDKEAKEVSIDIRDRIKNRIEKISKE